MLGHHMFGSFDRTSRRGRRRTRGGRGIPRPSAFIERLEERTLLAAGDPIISEFVASNSGGLADEDGDHSDWLEIYNPSASPVDLDGWALTDDPAKPGKWKFPSVTIDSGAFLVVFASGKNRKTPGAPLHTSFKLGASGDYLALDRPDGSVAQAYAPAYPPQVGNVSYGVAFDATTLVGQGATADVMVPTDGSLEGAWNAPGYTPGVGWIQGPTGVGYGILQPGFQVRYIKAANVDVSSIDVAEQVIADPTLQEHSVETSADTINYLNTGSGGNFAGDQPFPTQTIDQDVDQFVVVADGLVTIPTAGAWSFGVNSDDGFKLTLERNGQVFTTSFSDPRGAADTIQVFNIPEPGQWKLHLEYYEEGGGSELEVFAAPGSRPAFDGGVFRLVGDTANGGLAVASVLDVEPGDVSLVGRFVVDDLNGLADGAAVGAWADRDPNGDGSISAAANGAPTLVKDSLNGHSVVRFNPDDGGDQFRIAASSNPLSGVGDFAAAVVFRTSDPGAGGLGDWWSNSGLVDAEEAGQLDDWGLSFSGDGRVAAGIGNPDVSVYSRGGLADGQAHVAVIVRSGGVLSVYVDGRLEDQREDASQALRNVTDLVFGSLQTDLNFYKGDIAEVRLYNNDLTASEVQRLATELDRTYNIPDVIPSTVGTDVRDLMQGMNSTAYVLIPFDSPDPSQFDSLILRMAYDDGFVAYLNGVVVASANAPASPTYNSAATAERDGDPSTFATFSLTPFLNLLHAGTNILAIRSLNISAGDDDSLVLPELIGSRLHSDQFRYFGTPTPGGPNVDAYLGLVAPVSAGVGRGFFSSPFSASLSVPTAGARIMYTLDGSEPTATHGLLYDQPIQVTGTTNLRAGAFIDGYLSSASITETYLFLADVVDQSPDGSTPAGWPSSWGNNVVDYGMDPDIVDSPLYGPELEAALKAIPTISLTTDLANLFDPITGIYANAYQQGIDWERPASVELINPDGSPGFQIDAGLRIRGGYSRSGGNPKHAFRLFFRSEYGASSLDFPLFGSEGTDSYEKVDLRTAQNYSWSFGADPNNNFVAELFSRETMRDMGDPYTRSRFYQLYINGQYWGLYQTEERPDANYGASYFGGDADDYDVIKVESGPYTTQATDGNFDAWNRLWTAVADPDQSLASDANYYKLQGKNPDGTDNLNYEVLVDVDELIDYMIVILYGGNLDAPISAFLGNEYPNNFFAIRNRTGRQGFQFIMHDAEHTLLDVNEDRQGPYPAGQNLPQFNPQFLHQQLMANADYRLEFADHIQKAFFNGGPLSPEAAAVRFKSEAVQIRLAIIGESARWGDAQRPDSPLTQADWQAAVDRVLYQYLPYRTAVVLAQFRANGLYPAIDAPAFRVDGVLQNGGVVGTGHDLTITAPDGVIYYTADGSDPRNQDGSLNPSAVAYDPKTASTTLISAGSTWSYLDTGTDPGSSWTTLGYDASAWNSGPGQFGYGDGDESTVIGYGSDPDNKYITTYFRRTFSIADPSNIIDLSLNLLRDDGAVVYINGVEVARSNMPGGSIGSSTLASEGVGGDDESTYYTISLDPRVLVAGDNVIAVEVHQSAPDSSDVSFDLSLTAAASDASPIALAADSTVLSARVYQDGVWSALASARFDASVSAAAGNLAVTEIEYNPAPADVEAGEMDTDKQQFEFIELKNISDQEINLSGVKFTKGISFDFTGAAITRLAPGAYVLLAKNIAAFESRYGAGLPIAGTYGGASGGLASLSNSGEQLLLVDASGATIEDFEYGTKTPWPESPDGDGPSLVRIDLHADAGDPLNWRASRYANGSPGVPDPTPPTVGSVTDQSTDEDVPAAVELTIGDSETPVGSLVVNVTSSDDQLIPSSGIVVEGDGATRTLRLTPAPNAYGTATITITVTDETGLTTQTSFIVNVLPVDDAPVGRPESYTLDEDQSLSIPAASGVLSNDSDVEGDSVTAVLEIGPKHGTLDFMADGSFVYTPAANYDGVDGFTYHVNDGTLDSQRVAVQLDVRAVADPPSLAPIADRSVNELTTLSFKVAATDPDLPDDKLTFSLDPGSPAGATIDPNSGLFKWTPTEEQGPGTYMITVRVKDASSPATEDVKSFKVSVNEVNRLPVLAPLFDRYIDEGTTLDYVVSATDADVPVQALHYALAPGAPAGARIGALDGRIVWATDESTGPGLYAITIVVDDGSFNSSVAGTIRVHVAEVNRPPVLDPIPDAVLLPGESLDVFAHATDSDLPANLLTFSLRVGGPAGVSIDPSTGEIHWTPTPDQSGRRRITVGVADDGRPSYVVYRSFTVDVREPAVAAAPSIAVDSSAASVAGQSLALSGRFASDSSGPWAGVVDYGDGTGTQPLAIAGDQSFQLAHAYQAAGAYQAVVRIRDANGVEGSAAVRVTVNPKLDVPATGALVTIASATAQAGRGPGLAGVSVAFTGSTDAASATNVRNYRLVAPGRDGRLGTRDDVVLRIASAVYDEALHTVVLRPRSRLSWPAARPLGLTVLGGSLRDASGRAIDGDDDGAPGGDSHVVVAARSQSNASSRLRGRATAANSRGELNRFLARRVRN